MRVIPIPANADNYQYLIVDSKSNKGAIVDPVDVDGFFNVIKKENADLFMALVTHHHWDHAGGTEELKSKKPDVKIYGGDAKRIKSIDHVVEDNEEIEFGNLKIRALKTPCHTSTHICYYITDEAENQKCVFTGDTLFIGGCGRFFEGTAEEMNYALNEKLGKLPDDTKVYCGHEYTIKNLEFASSVEPNNPNILSKLEWAKNLRKQNGFTVPSTIGEEKTFNPFMRVSNAGIQEKLGTLNDPIATMQKLRDLKNKF
uniref:hydroxyacylglutathione hydrolase n=1 Tax=Meloidogyne incognita TaxID=6306 RepID=A0A914LXR3_MELIC